jgi:Rieske Fe-S protein
VSPQLISRRSTLSGLVISVAGGVAGYFWARNTGAAKAKSATTGANSYGYSSAPAGGTAPAGGSAPASGGELLVPVSKVPPGGGIILTKQQIVLTSGPGGTIHAFSAVCTHQGCTVNNISGGVISCPCHGSRYDTQTGAVVGGPAPAPLPKIAVVIRNNNIYSV